MENSEKIRIALIGVGNRGGFWLGQLLAMKDVEVTAVGDIHADRVEAAKKRCADVYGHEVFGSTDYRELVGREDVDAVIAATYWNDHVKVAIAAMKAGKYAAIEVGAAQSMRQCWDLVRTYEETGMPCMMLENCCYSRNEMTVLNMIKKGLFGEVVHCEGGYEHDLRSVMSTMKRDHERLWQHWHRNADVYPTHELGPIMKWLNINHGNRMMTLTSMASKQRGLTNYVKKNLPADDPLQNEEFRLGDVITTCISCANGETVVLTLENNVPRPYSRGNRVDGTNGMYMEDKNSVYFEDRSPAETWEPIEKYREEYEHPLWKKTNAGSITTGHGGMDWLVMRAFIESVRRRIEPPIDVYDTASLLAVSVLSEESVSLGGAPVAIPDFTDGMWLKRAPGPKSVFSLDEIDEALFEGDISF